MKLNFLRSVSLNCEYSIFLIIHGIPWITIFHKMHDTNHAYHGLLLQTSPYNCETSVSTQGHHKCSCLKPRPMRCSPTVCQCFNTLLRNILFEQLFCSQHAVQMRRINFQTNSIVSYFVRRITTLAVTELNHLS